MRYVRSATAATATTIAALVMWGSPAAASPDQDVFDGNDNTWACEDEGTPPLPDYHCLNIRSQGNTGIIKVFEPDTRWPQESISFDPKSDGRPCPQDPVSIAGDGTWWSPGPGTWVCHHRP